jgi:hypothetical protein
MMNIPDEAVEALIGSLGWRLVDGVDGAAREALGAAAPSIAAQALRDAANAAYELEDGTVIDVHRSGIAEWLEERAKDVEAK